MPDVLDALRESGGSTEPDSVFRAELMGRVRDALAAPDVSGQESALVPNSRRSTGHDRRRTSIVLAAAAFVAAAIAGIVWYGARRSGEPATPSVDTSLSDRAYAPLSGEVFAVSQAADGLVLDHRQFAVTESGAADIAVAVDPAHRARTARRTVGRRRVRRTELGVHGHVLRRCWRHGPTSDRRRLARRRSRRHAAPGSTTTSSSDHGYVDPLTGTVVLGDPGSSSTVIDEPGAVDVTVIAAGFAAALVAGDDPHVVRVPGRRVHRARRNSVTSSPRRTERAPSSDSMSPWWCSPATPRATNNASPTTARRSTSAPVAPSPSSTCPSRCETSPATTPG